MSNQLGNESFILNANTPIALRRHDGISLVPQHLVRGPVSTPVNDGTATGTIWPSVNNANCEINYNLLQVTDDSQHQQVSFPTGTLPQLVPPPPPPQNMSQTAQIVLLPTQNINLVPNDVGYQLLTSAVPNVGVLVPTNLLLTNGYILLPNSQQNACQPSLPVPMEAVTSTQTRETTVTGDHIITANVEYEAAIAPQHHQQHAQQQQLEQECEFIALADTSTQTVLSGIADTSELNGQATHLISNNGQIVGIIGGDQLSLLQADPGGENGGGGGGGQVLLATCIDPNENGIHMAGQAVAGSVAGGPSYDQVDINSMLASTISTLAVEKSDQNQAKQWLKDSYIVNRALKALKKTASSSHHHHHSRPHPQVIRRRD